MAASSSPSSSNPSQSYFTPTVMLMEWWLVKTDTGTDTDADSNRKTGLAVSGTTSYPNQAKRVFLSAPIAERLGDFTVETSDGVCLLLQSFINAQRTIDNGFSSQVAKSFAIGFPKDWQLYADKCCGQDSNSERENPAQDSSFFTDIQNASPKAAGTATDEVPNSPLVVTTRTRSKVNQPVKSPIQSVNKSPMTRSRMKEKTMGVCQSKTGDKNLNISNHGCESRAGSVPYESTEERQGKSCDPKRGNKSRNLRPKGADAKEKRATKEKAEPKRKSSDAKEPKTPENKTKRKIKFDEKVTPPPQTRQDNPTKCIVSPESRSVGRSRSGRILLPVLEFWRNEIPVYDLDRNVTGISEEQTVAESERGGGRSESRKKRKL